MNQLVDDIINEVVPKTELLLLMIDDQVICVITK